MKSPNVNLTKNIWQQLSQPLRKALLKDFSYYDFFHNRVLWHIEEELQQAEKYMGVKGASKLAKWLDAEVTKIVARESGLLHGDTIMTDILDQDFDVDKVVSLYRADVAITREAQKILRREGIIRNTDRLQATSYRDVPTGDNEGDFEEQFVVLDKKGNVISEGSLFAVIAYDYPTEDKILVEFIAFTRLK